MKKTILVFALLFGCTNNQTTTVPVPQPSAQTASSKQEQTPDVHAGENNDFVPAPSAAADSTVNTPEAMPPPITVPSPSPSPTKEQPPAGRQPATAAATPVGLAGDDGSTPMGAGLTYSSLDGERIQYYKAFVAGTLSAEDFARLLFKDPDFNRAVAVVGDLYRQDKLRGNLTPESEARFQELGQRVGAAVLVYNQRRRSEHYTELAGGVAIGTVAGATLGGLMMKEEWIPEFVKTSIGDRLPVYARDALLGGIVGGGTIFVTMETFHVIDDLAHPQNVYNADPLLDGPVR